MTSFLVGIIVLVLATLAVSKSLVSGRSDERGATDGDYVDDDEEYEYAKPTEDPRRRSPFDADPRLDDLSVDPEAEAEDRRLTGVWDE